MIEFRPALLTSLKHYSREKFTADLMAGIIVGIVALPLAIAFGIASGVSPEKGIITAIIAGFLTSALGGSRVQIGGPTGAFIVIVYGIIQQYGIEGLTVATIMAGVFLILLGLFRLGTIIKFIPYPIVVGFTSGIAVTIFTTQIKDLFGLTTPEMPGDFAGKWIVYFQNFGTIDLWATAVGVISVAIIALTPRFSKKIPGSLIAIVVMTLAVYLLKRYAGIDSVETIGDRFTINSQLPDAVIPALSWEGMKGLLPAAITIAVLGAIESLLSATVADGVTGGQAQLQPGAHGPRHRQRGDASVRRHSRHRSHRPHDDQYQQRRPHAGRRRHPCRRTAADLPVPDAAGAIYPDGLLGRRAGSGIVQHERMAHVPGSDEESPLGCRGAIGHLPADGHHRPDGGHRSRTGTRLPALHAARDGNYRHLGHPQRNRPR